MSSLGG